MPGIIVHMHVLLNYFPQSMDVRISIYNYQHISTIFSHFSMVFVGFCCFFGTAKLIRLCHFNQRISFFIKTLQLCGKELISFAMMLMNFDAHELTDVAAFLSPFCFNLFILFVVFVCMSMFLSIISQSFRQARENISNDQKIYSFMFERVFRWIK